MKGGLAYLIRDVNSDIVVIRICVRDDDGLKRVRKQDHWKKSPVPV